MKTLTSTLSLFSLLILLTTTSCKTGFLAFDLDFEAEEIVFTVNPTDKVGDIGLTTSVVQSSLEEKLVENGTTMDKLRSVKLNKLTFTILSPRGQTFNGLEYAEVQLAAPGVAPVIVAQLNDIPDDNSYHLEVPIASMDDLSEILSQPQFTFIAKGTTSEPIYAPVTIQANMSFDAKIGI